VNRQQFNTKERSQHLDDVIHVTRLMGHKRLRDDITVVLETAINSLRISCSSFAHFRKNNQEKHPHHRQLAQEFRMADEFEDDGLWEKPAWAKGGHKLKSTGKAEAMKTKGDLAAPITKIREDKDAMRKIKKTQEK
jgi:hypothetical protein